jgi:hypothetical protein
LPTSAPCPIAVQEVVDCMDMTLEVSGHYYHSSELCVMENHRQQHSDLATGESGCRRMSHHTNISLTRSRSA